MTTPLENARFGGDSELLQRICRDDVLKRELARSEVLRRRSMLRAKLRGFRKFGPNIRRYRPH